MTTIWKFSVPVDDTVSVDMPKGAETLSVQLQDGLPMLWAIVDDKAPMVARTFRWRGTGHPLRAVGDFVGTVQSGGLVFHLFED